MTPKLLDSSTFSLHYAKLLIEFAACFIIVNYISTINIVLTLVYLILIPPVLPVIQHSVFYPALSTSVLPVFQL